MLIALTIACIAALAVLPLLALRSEGAARASASLAGAARRVVTAAFWISCAAALLLALVQMAVVVLQSVFALSVIALQESTLYLFGAMFLLAGGAALLADEHVRVDVFYTRWSLRRRAVVDLAGLTLFVLPVCALIVIAAGPYVAASWSELERSPEPSGIHLVYLLKTLIPAFGVVLALAAFVRTEALVRALRGR